MIDGVLKAWNQRRLSLFFRCRISKLRKSAESGFYSRQTGVISKTAAYGRILDTWTCTRYHFWPVSRWTMTRERSQIRYTSRICHLLRTTSFHFGVFRYVASLRTRRTDHDLLTVRWSIAFGALGHFVFGISDIMTCVRKTTRFRRAFVSRFSKIRWRVRGVRGCVRSAIVWIAGVRGSAIRSIGKWWWNTWIDG